MEAASAGEPSPLEHYLRKMSLMATDQLEEEKKRIHASTRQDLLTRNLSNSEKYDNAILTLSTGFLAISLAFIKDIVPSDKSQYEVLLIISWCVFGASIVSTLVSFVLSQLAIKRQLEYAEKYYLEEKDEYLEKKNRPALWTEFVNYASGILFITGIAATICFVSLNIKGGDTMPKDTNQLIEKGATVPNLQKVQKVTAKEGATIPNMQPVKASTTTSQQSTSQDSQSGGDTGKTEK